MNAARASGPASPNSEPNSDVSGGILAGGLGRRMGGVDKGWVLHDGRPLIQWVLQALRPQVAEVWISANRNLDRYARLDAQVVVDDGGEPGQGPFAGMVRLLESARQPWLLCVPCDTPTLPPDLAAQMRACVQRDAADIAVLADAHGLHPTFCLIRTALAADARAAFDAGERAPRRWFAGHRLARLCGAAPVNLNAPAGAVD